jgi:hypothetical protein
LQTAKVLQPGEQVLVALASGGKGVVAQPLTMRIECHGVMLVQVAVHATDDDRLRMFHTAGVVSFVCGATPVVGGRTEQ